MPRWDSPAFEATHAAVRSSVWHCAIVAYFLIFTAICCQADDVQTQASPNPFDIVCEGKCAATFMVGRQLDTGLAHVDGLKSFIPPWQYDYGNSFFFGAALSRSLIEFDRFAKIEVEGGIGNRFGVLNQSEAWGAFYFRWVYFPWSSFLRTSVAVSTGLSYASTVTPYEVSEAVDGKGTRLLHYFSPEITFALPSRPDTEVAIRVHHRSGGGAYFGENFPVYGSLFHGAQGGMQYLTLGLRQHF